MPTSFIIHPGTGLAGDEGAELWVLRILCVRNQKIRELQGDGVRSGEQTNLRDTETFLPCGQQAEEGLMAEDCGL